MICNKLNNKTMTQEEKDLLLKDLCARLSYGVKVVYENKVFSVDYISAKYEEIKLNIPDNYTLNITEVKPYLFPISSMTEEQCKELYDISEIRIAFTPDRMIEVYKNTIEWFLKNHIDYNGLIEKGLAIDCTNLNIY